MSFRERFESPRAMLCAIGEVVDGLPDDEAAFLRDMLADPKAWPHTGEKSIQEAIEEEGFGRINDKLIRAHRAGTCRCARSSA